MEEGLKQICSLTPAPLLKSAIPFSASLSPYPKTHKAPGVLAKCYKAGKFLIEEVCNQNTEAMDH